MSTESIDFDESALESLRSDLTPEVSAYRAVLEGLEPSPRHRASMERMLVELVRDDVREQWRRDSLRSSVSGAWRRWSDAWRDLVERSLVFRVASQGAMALGAGLVLAILFTAPDGGNSAGAWERPEMETPTQQPTPVAAEDPDGLGADAFRRSLDRDDRRGLATPIRDRK